jgi:hypothetical protein
VADQKKSERPADVKLPEMPDDLSGLVLDPQDITAPDVAKLQPQARLDFNKARQAYADAYYKYEAAREAALQDLRKPYVEFNRKLAAYRAAVAAEEEAVRQAEAKAAAVSEAADFSDVEPTDPAAVSNALAGLDAARSAYKAATDDVAAKAAAKQTALDALNWGKGFDIDKPDLSPAARVNAAAQFEVADAQAAVALDTAHDLYLVQAATISGTIAHGRSAPAKARAPEKEAA